MHAKNQLHLSCFSWDILEILQNCCFLYFGHAWLCTPKVIQPTCRKPLCFICRQKIKFISNAFLDILQRYANFLFWVLLACLVGHTQNYSINLQKTLMFICTPKINFIIHFFLEILHLKIKEFDWLTAFWLITREPEHGISGEISTTISVFILDYFHEKIMTKFVKNFKKPYFEPFFPILGKN